MATATAQIIASSVFAFAGAVIAATAVVVSYRNNFGWPPVVLFLKYVWGGDREHPGFVPLEIQFEFWNRQKYPLAIREIKIFMGDVEFSHKSEGPETSPGWTPIQPTVLLYRESRQSLEANKHIAFTVRTSIKAKDTGYGHKVRIHVNYFDPIKNKNRITSNENDFDADVPDSYSYVFNEN